MIEAVNASIANAPLVRPVAEVTSTSRNIAINVANSQAAEAPRFISPYVSIGQHKVILQFRDNNTGDVLRQFPTAAQLEAYAQAQARSESVRRAEANAVSDQEVIVESSVQYKEARAAVNADIQIDIDVPEAPPLPAQNTPISIDIQVTGTSAPVEQVNAQV
ncbi:MAG: hypothetical protein GC136_06950 [Alphaproteobacteria bacterium]|nr:hypothetical protein [Alphaproteobacteria bacterium]